MSGREILKRAFIAGVVALLANAVSPVELPAADSSVSSVKLKDYSFKKAAPKAKVPLGQTAVQPPSAKMHKIKVLKQPVNLPKGEPSGVQKSPLATHHALSPKALLPAQGAAAPGQKVLPKPGGALGKVTNVGPTFGGAGQEATEGAERRVPESLRHRDRAVTKEDFRPVASETPGVDIHRAEVEPSGEDAQGKAKGYAKGLINKGRSWAKENEKDKAAEQQEQESSKSLTDVGVESAQALATTSAAAGGEIPSSEGGSSSSDDE